MSGNGDQLRLQIFTENTACRVAFSACQGASAQGSVYVNMTIRYNFRAMTDMSCDDQIPAFRIDALTGTNWLSNQNSCIAKCVKIGLWRALFAAWLRI